MTTKLQVSGMTCSSCVSILERSLKTVLGVETATVEGSADVSALVATIEDEGYQATVVNG